MYGKLFSSMYEGTLYGQWQGIVTLQQLVILADADGIVDMTPPAIAARTSIPLEIIEAGLTQLAEVDKYSRTPTEDGRRIVLIDEDRPWGWRIVNYTYYRDLASREDKKAKDRERLRRKRGEASGYDGPLTGEDCSYCGQPATGIDHIIPRAISGPNTDLNTTPACNRCNSSKRDRALHDFLNDSKTEIDVERVLKNPKLTRLVAFCRNSSRFVANVAHTDTDTDTKKKKKARKRAVFVKPTVEQVAEYCRKRGNSVNPESFCAYYDSNGWKVGRNPMRDWQAAVRTWEKRNETTNGATRKPVFEQPHERRARELAEAIAEAEGASGVEADDGNLRGQILEGVWSRAK